MCIDGICVLERGVISWQDLTSGAIVMRKAGSYVFASDTSPGNVLLFLMTALHSHLAVARYNPKFDIKGYVKESLGEISNYWAPGGPSMDVVIDQTGAKLVLPVPDSATR